MTASVILDVEEVTAYLVVPPTSGYGVLASSCDSQKPSLTRSGTGAQKPETDMSAPDSTSQQLEYLREAYVYKVNAALERGREDLAAELADDYLDEVRHALEVASRPRG
jgi:hypothetical protein